MTAEKKGIIRPNLTKIISEIEKWISSDRVDWQYKDFLKIDFFWTKTNYLYVFHTGALIRKLTNTEDVSSVALINNHPLINDFDERLSKRLWFWFYPIQWEWVTSFDEKNIKMILWEKTQSNLLVNTLIKNEVYNFIENPNGRVWFRKDFSIDFRDKYIGVFVDFTMPDYHDIQNFVIDDIKTKGNWSKKGTKTNDAFMEKMKIYISNYLKNWPIPSQQLIEDPYFVKDDFKEILQEEEVDKTPTEEYLKAISLIGTRDKGVYALWITGASMTLWAYWLWVNPYIIGGIGIIWIAIVPYLFYRIFKKNIRKKMDRWQDKVTEKELEKIEEKLWF